MIEFPKQGELEALFQKRRDLNAQLSVLNEAVSLLLKEKDSWEREQLPIRRVGRNISGPRAPKSKTPHVTKFFQLPEKEQEELLRRAVLLDNYGKGAVKERIKSRKK